MQDVQQSGPVTPGEDELELPEDGLADGEEDAVETPTNDANDSDGPSRSVTPAQRGSAVPQRRRAGRPFRTKPHDWSAMDDIDQREGTSDLGTPRKRGGWRGRGFGGGRWAKPRGGPSHVSQVPLDKEGNMANVVDDEVELADDAEGETKVDKMGHLKDGREYRVRVFTIAGKGDRLYMLSTEPARCIGFRDSYLFFQRHPQLFKIILPEEAKRDLIERSIIPHSYKGRAIGVVTARSVFREFGAKIIIGGRKIVDDYQVKAARESGDTEGELAVPEDAVPITGKDYDRNRYVAWHGASSVYHSGIPTVPMQNGKALDGKKRKIHVTDVNWMFEHAQAARLVLPSYSLPDTDIDLPSSRYNSRLHSSRRQNFEGIYELHTNSNQYPKIMQPTHARWERLPYPHPTTCPDEPPTAHRIQEPTTDESMQLIKSIHLGYPVVTPTTFPSPTSAIARYCMIADTYYHSPSKNNLGVPGPDGDEHDVGSNGLCEVPTEIIACLPPDCLEPFLDTQAEERRWKDTWRTESQDGSRSQPHITYCHYKGPEKEKDREI